MKRLAIDIETIGILHGRPQSYFHPRKVEVFDGVSRDDMILTVALGWREHSRKFGAVLRWKDGRDRAYLRKVLIRAKVAGWWLTGANTMYDIMFLRHCDPSLRGILTPFVTRLRDVLIVNHLAYDQRPERSLKTGAHLFGVTSYDTERTYASDQDPDLWRYNLQDCHATLDLDDILVEQIKTHYGADSDKLSEWSMNWFSDTMWSLIHKQEVGIQMEPAAVQELHDQTCYETACLNNESLNTFSVPLFGKGSQKDTDQFFIDLVRELGLEGEKDLDLTKATKKISTGRNNLNLLLEKLEECEDEDARVWTMDMIKRLRLIDESRRLWKLASTYTRPMLEPARRKGREEDRSCMMIEGRVYPQWFPIPMFAKDDSGETGGTIQARYAAKDPAAQTWPKDLKACMTSRFPRGYIVEADQSQMELRMPALLSGDPVMMETFAAGGDFHANMIIRLMGEGVKDREDFKQLREAGKAFDFGAFFGAGSPRLRKELRKKVGLSWTLEEVTATLKWFRDQLHRAMEWQDELVDLACRQQYLMIPFTGHSRSFSGSPQVIRATYRDNIRNFPVQGPSAVVLQSAEIEITKECYARHLRACVPINGHDAIGMDVPANERTTVQALIDRWMPSPPYYDKLCEMVGRRVPLKVDSTWKGPFNGPNNLDGRR